jgi:cell division protein FtsB
MRRDARKVWLYRGLGAALLVLTFGYVPYHLYKHSGFARYLERRHEHAYLKAQNARLRSENARLAREADALRSDLRAVEQIARAELNWVRPGEVIFELGNAQ